MQGRKRDAWEGEREREKASERSIDYWWKIKNEKRGLGEPSHLHFIFISWLNNIVWSSFYVGYNDPHHIAIMQDSQWYLKVLWQQKVTSNSKQSVQLNSLVFYTILQSLQPLDLNCRGHFIRNSLPSCTGLLDFRRSLALEINAKGEA